MGSEMCIRDSLVAVRTERLKLKDELAALELKMDGYLKDLGF